MFKSKVALLIAGLSFSVASMAATQIGTNSTLNIEVPIAAPSTLTSVFEPAADLIAGAVSPGTVLGNIHLVTTGAGNINTVKIVPNNPAATFSLSGSTSGTSLPITIGAMTEVTSSIADGNTTSTVVSPAQEQYLTVYAHGTPVADVFSGTFTVSVFSA
ncbi:hypothetical protein KGP17_22545 [Serratia sp. JSRIV001]|uniref:hypothetical protein n=1 Tax=unclassified Serratia (in: enterobacteria) TaxID=2647522 RepID=UPI001CC0793D|nr:MULTISPECIES: hypothetical protein [unclassified Serratia (in: enterobacteria)]UAN45154.1 hypothetical protein KGP17_22545 [Serratia sp. JSRIV001]UAN50661.1 hypothetical protein KGP26_23585 [Serratia sp. JSRIV002]UAN56618.1 hypothetical protein KGP21_23760 [Serratia sp. JSRIV004]